MLQEVVKSAQANVQYYDVDYKDMQYAHIPRSSNSQLEAQVYRLLLFAYIKCQKIML